jgi:hypothetical protein
MSFVQWLVLGYATEVGWVVDVVLVMQLSE